MYRQFAEASCGKGKEFAGDVGMRERIERELGRGSGA